MHGKMCGSPNSLHACESINSVLKSLSWLWLFPCWQGLCCKQILNSFGVHKQFPPVSHFQFHHLKTRATVFAETTSGVGISNLRLLSRAWFLETWTCSIFCVLRQDTTQITRHWTEKAAYAYLIFIQFSGAPCKKRQPVYWRHDCLSL